MSKILELREKRAKAWEAAKALLDSKRGDDGLLSAEDTASYEKMESDVVNLGKEIDRLERQAVIDLEMSRATSTPIKNKPNGNPACDAKTGRASDEYKQSFWKAMREKNSYGVQNALQIGTDSEGGYLVPDEFEATIISSLQEENIVRQVASIIITSSGDRKIPVSTSKGSASWVDEEGAIPESDDVFGQVNISAHKLATMIKISEELLNDSAFNLERYIATEFARRISTKEEEAFLVGDGVAKPVGIFNTTGGSEVGVTANSSTVIAFDDIMDLYYSLRSPYRKKAVFMTNESTIKAIRKIKDANGQYIWQPSTVLGEPDSIFGKRILTSAYVPELGAGNKTIAFGDFSYYWIADRQGRSFQRLNELYAPNGQVGFRGTQRVDGKLILSEAVKSLQMKSA